MDWHKFRTRTRTRWNENFENLCWRWRKNVTEEGGHSYWKKEKKKNREPCRLVPETLHERFSTEAALPHSLKSSRWWNRRCCCRPCPNHRTLSLYSLFCCKLPCHQDYFSWYIVSCFSFRRDCVLVLAKRKSLDLEIVCLCTRESWREPRLNCVVKM